MFSQTNVVSFVLRFVQETADTKHPVDDADRSSGLQHQNDTAINSSQADWHGVIKHVQTDTKQYFTHIADALAFMARYVRLGDLSGIGESEIQNSGYATPDS